MKLLRKPGHVSIFPTSRQSGLGAIPGSEFQFPFGIKWSTNYNFAIGWKLSSKGPTQHFPWVGSIIALSRPTVQGSLRQSPVLLSPCPSHLPFPSLLPEGPLLGAPCLCFCLLQQKISSKFWEKKYTTDCLWLLQAGALLMGLYLPAHCVLHLPGA